MSWNNAAVTNAGVALLNESLAGHILTITSAVGGAGTLEDQELASAVDVVDQKQTFCLMGLEDLEQGKQVGVQISNKGVSESYILHQIGVKAKLEYEEEETLLFLLQDDRGVEIPAEAENPDFLFEVYATIAISNKANITINVNPHVVASVDYVDRTFVKLTRKINGKDLSQDVTLTGEDIPVSEEDDRNLNEVLSEKANIDLVMCRRPVSGEDLNKPYPYPYSNMVGPESGFGPREEYWYIEYFPFDENTGIQVITSPTGKDRWFRTFHFDVPGEWLQIATATLPEESDLPLVDGWTNVDRSTYFKTQENVVVLTLSAQYISGAITGESHVATLPEGYRPAKTIPALCGIGELGSTTGYIKVDASGNVFFGAGEQSINKVFAQILFIGS